MINDKIDIVYLWVDGSDENWLSERNYWHSKIYGNTTKTSNLNSSMYRDNGELMYSLRSVAECVPWINHIYIVTGFNQIPSWLDTSNPKITIVPHESIFPSDALPTFNSTAIEMCIPNIVGLSEHFILMNDDTFFNKHISPNFFFTKNNRAIILYNKQKNRIRDTNKWLEKSDNYTSLIIASALKINEIFGKTKMDIRPSHGIDPYIKSSVCEYIKNPMVTNQIQQQIHNKFRVHGELHRWMFNLYDLMMGRAILKKARGYKSGKHKLSNFIYNTLHWRTVRQSPVFCFDAMESYESIKHSPIFCINDSPESTDTTLMHNLNFLQNRFPKKSEFEK